VGEEVAVARGLPAGGAGAEVLGIDRDEHEVALAGEVAAHRLGELGGRGEVDEAVPEIDRGAGVGVDAGGIAPLRGGATL
jgi:hypothetical protein